MEQFIKLFLCLYFRNKDKIETKKRAQTLFRNLGSFNLYKLKNIYGLMLGGITSSTKITKIFLVPSERKTNRAES